MAKSTTYIMGMFLSVLLLAAAQLQADTVTFTFQGANTTTRDNIKGTDGTSSFPASSKFYLTATDTGNGVEFNFSSDWKINSAPITIKSPLYFYGVNDVFDFGANVGKGATGMNLYEGFNDRAEGVGYVSGKSFEKVGDQWVVPKITLNYAEGMEWEGFLASLGNKEDMFAFYASVGNMTTAGWSGQFITTGAMGTPSTPEPATLALMGLGLAGLGMVSRRKRK